jgi:hypothetical protein
MQDEKLIKIGNLTKDERAAVAPASLLQPPVPDGHLYLYRADVAGCTLRHRGRCKSPACRLLRNCLQFPDEVWAGWKKLKHALKTEHKVTTLFFYCVMALAGVVFVSLFIKNGVAGHESTENAKEALKASAKLIETAGDLALALGALWTASGVILSNQETQKLVTSVNTNVSESLAILKAAAATASKRAWQGVGMLIFGTAMLLVKTWWLD